MKTNTPTGFFVDIMDAITRDSGLQVQYICRTDWSQMISAVVSGEADISVLLKSKEREKELLFSTPIDMTYLSFFTRSQSNADAYKVPVEGYSVGVVKGSMSYEQLKKWPELRLQAANSYEEGIFKLLAGEADLFAGEDTSILKAARGAGLEDRIKKVGKPFVERERGIAIRKDNVHLLGLFNNSLAKFIGTPEYQRIYIKWYGAPTPYWTLYRIVTACGIVLFIVVCGMAFWRYRSLNRLNRELMCNIRDRERAEEDLWKSRNMLSQILNTMPQSIFWKDRDSVYLGCNDVFARATGLGTAREIVGKTDFDLPWPREEAEAYRADDREVMMEKKPKLHIIEPLQQADGSRLWIDTSKVPLTDREGEVFGVLGVYDDITERKLAEEKIKESEQFIRNILDTVDEGFIVIDRDYRILIANKAYCCQVGVCDEYVVGEHCYKISHKILRPCYEEGEECAVRQAFATGEPHTSLHRHLDPNGAVIYVETKAFPLKDAAGTVTSVIETLNNITERHLLEEEQLKSQKLEAIGTLAGGIAHDFNNLLQGVFGFISMAKRLHEQKQKSLDMLEQAERALHLSVNLTSQLLTFSKGGKPVKERILLRSIVEDSVKFALSGSRSDYSIKTDKELWMVEADEGQINQVIQNIVLNAEQAMPLGGTVTIAMKNVNGGQKGLPLSIKEGSYVEISISDSGMGIPEHTLRRIFDPYFTTKDKGSGLGLATAYSIIKNHGGLIDVKSKPSEGTTFFVYLPAVRDVDALPVKVHEDSKATRNGRILLMDDDDIIRKVVGTMISSLGHEVEVVKNGHEAIAKYKEFMKDARKFDVVIMDLTVRGGMGGEAAIRELLDIDPDVSVIVSSGYTESSAIAEYKTLGFKACLVKPYDITTLNATLQSLLA